MPDADKILLDKLTKLVAAERELQAKLAAIHAEVDALLAGKPGVGARIRAFQAAFVTAWQTRYHGEYLWTATRDVPHIKRLLQAFPDDELATRAASYIRNPDPFYLQRRHPFVVFASSINSHGGVVTVTSTEFICPHTPRHFARHECYIRSQLDAAREEEAHGAPTQLPGMERAHAAGPLQALRPGDSMGYDGPGEAAPLRGDRRQAPNGARRAPRH
jgi:hypothetical protein